MLDAICNEMFTDILGIGKSENTDLKTVKKAHWTSYSLAQFVSQLLFDSIKLVPLTSLFVKVFRLITNHRSGTQSQLTVSECVIFCRN